MNATTKKIGVLDLSNKLYFLCLCGVVFMFGFYIKHFIDMRDLNNKCNLLNSKISILESEIRSLDEKINTEVEILNNKIVAKKLTVTAYSASKKECDSDPNIAASMSRVRPGTIAVSRDLFEQGWVFGKKVYIENHGIFTINDLMNKKHSERVDVFIGHKKKAKSFGKKELVVALLPDEVS